MPERLEDVRDRAIAAPRGDAGPDGVAETEDVDDVGPFRRASAAR